MRQEQVSQYFFVGLNPSVHAPRHQGASRSKEFQKLCSGLTCAAITRGDFEEDRDGAGSKHSSPSGGPTHRWTLHS